MYLKFFITLLLLSLVRGENEKIKYYKKIIMEGIEKSRTYTFPKNFHEYIPKNSKPIRIKIFDYVIIGAGSTGSAVAGKLAKNSNYTILLLEAGQNQTKLTDIPAMSRYFTNSKYNWGINSTKQDNCCLGTGGICHYISGKIVGGSGTIDSLLYSRGIEPDYDKWASLGNPGWSYKDILPYYLEMEDTQIKHDDKYRGVGGPIEVTYTNPISSKTFTYLKANKELGYNIIDYNAKNHHGVGILQFNTKDGNRDTAATSFLKASKERNLKILTKSFVTKILISKQMEAYGVIFSHKNVKYRVTARKEIILSAGAIFSPQLLMLSGVGPKQLLDKFGIKTKMDLSVGENLLHRPIFNGIQILTSEKDFYPNLTESIKEYLNFGVGRLTTAQNTQGIGFIKGKTEELREFEVEHLFTPSNIGLDSNGSALVELNTFIDPWNETIAKASRLSSLFLVLLYPKTTGRVYIKSKSPYEYPIFESNCFADSREEDIDNLYRSLQVVLKLVETQAFKKIEARILIYKPCSHFPTTSRNYWICTIRHNSINNLEGTGTCKMGPNPHSGAVVDRELKVYGIKRLRVADGSVVPLQTSAHINAIAMMLGLKAVDMILRDSENN